jgi:hypothetical protein
MWIRLSILRLCANPAEMPPENLFAEISGYLCGDREKRPAAALLSYPLL